MLKYIIRLNRKEFLVMEINKDMKIGELLEIAPEKINILLEAGMHCIGCPASQAETLEEACMVHGIDVQDILDVINEKEDEDIDPVDPE